MGSKRLVSLHHLKSVETAVFDMWTELNPDLEQESAHFILGWVLKELQLHRAGSEVTSRLQRISERVDHTELARGEDDWVLEVSEVLDVPDAVTDHLVTATVETHTAESETIEGCLDRIEKALAAPGYDDD